MFRKSNSRVCEDFKFGIAFDKFSHYVIILFSENVSGRSFQKDLADSLKINYLSQISFFITPGLLTNCFTLRVSKFGMVASVLT
jgi:hypothetical protein